MKYYARSKFSRSVVHKKNFNLIWHEVFKLGYVFCQERQDALLSLNELLEESQATIILGKFVNKS